MLGVGMVKASHFKSGDRKGRLTAIEPVGTNNFGKKIWRFACDCGNEHFAVGSNVFNGKTSSCGCYKKEILSNRSHGMSNSRTYRNWSSLKERCYNKNSKSYQWYGAIGIIVCDRWKDSFENFLEDMGEKPEGFTIERINVQGNYFPENCCWANWYAQSINKRTSLSENDVKLIFELREKGYLQKEIANIVGCKQPQVSAILLGQSRNGTKIYKFKNEVV